MKNIVKSYALLKKQKWLLLFKILQNTVITIDSSCSCIILVLFHKLAALLVHLFIILTSKFQHSLLH